MRHVAPLDPDAPAARALIGGLNAHLSALYGMQRDLERGVAALKQAGVCFLGAFVAGQPVACGAVRMRDDDGTYGEIKSVFVVPEHRGQGHSRAIMHALEAHLIERRIDLARLMTGTAQPEAIALYTRLGYALRSPYGVHTADEATVFMEKRLVRPCR
ncbi:GNAT family N-acetyltransferase [Lysobacter niastensis]|uniref:GNAT family N-acetyltransferase n=1 Tax=Lysobacter niastensis TaxID=380629 RepID=A0ABS0B3R7_9GAMM|nr:GNAT family N-acetyltransferase [Lysobacter niastensis]MBF6023111.1 GNAT family N-acetyltransferase [Lysobacter niastensis]